MNNFLEIKNLSIAFPGNHLVNTLSDFNLKLDKNGSLGIVGESGSGKTLSMLALTRLLPKQAIVSSGSIDFLNHNLSEIDNLNFYKNFSGKKISMIFQEPMTSLNPVFSIGDQINEVLFIHNNLRKKIATDKTIDLLSKVGIPRPEVSYKKYPHQLSGGQRQRVMIAMALACSPKLLIADEPTTALDVIVQSQILNIINNLRRELNMSVLLITHDLGLVQDFCDRVYVMYDGKILENADCVKLFKSPQHQYTKDLLMTRPAANPPGKRLPIIKNTY